MLKRKIDRAGDRGVRGVRLDPEHDQRTRAKIQTSQIINRLNSFVNGKVTLTAAQVTAALGLLRKTMPDLARTEVTGANQGPVEVVDATAREYVISQLARISKSEEAPSDPAKLN